MIQPHLLENETAHLPPILTSKSYAAPSVFTANRLLEAARAQKGLSDVSVPAICILDPDGDLVDYARTTLDAQAHPAWACYHTMLATFTLDNIEYGLIGRAVGASFAVLVAEELFAAGCKLLISITSAGQITPVAAPPYFVLIESALRDEGTSYHYLPPAPFSTLSSRLTMVVQSGWESAPFPLYQGSSWTTDAPFRETATSIQAAQAQGVLTVEMEAAALYAFATATQRDVICFAHVTNQMGQESGDFEKGVAHGSEAALVVIKRTAAAWQRQQTTFQDSTPLA